LIFAAERGVVNLDGHRVILNEFLRRARERGVHAMTAPPSIDLSGWLTEQLAEASPDLLRR
jgi:hypothetical protein